VSAKHECVSRDYVNAEIVVVAQEISSLSRALQQHGCMHVSANDSASPSPRKGLQRARATVLIWKRSRGPSSVAVWVTTLGLVFGSEACQAYDSDLLDGAGTRVSASNGGTAMSDEIGTSLSAAAGGAGGECADCADGSGVGAVGGVGGTSGRGVNDPEPANGGSGGERASGGSASGGGASAAGSASGGSTSSGGGALGGSGGAVTEPPCAGKNVSGHCVYLGATGDSCEEACAEHGGVAADATSFLGTPAQGGSLRDCTDAMRALGIVLTPTEATRADGRGLGCHLYASQPYWLTSPAFMSTSAYVYTRIVCACEQ
jgi:hypothetical protein